VPEEEISLTDAPENILKRWIDCVNKSDVENVVNLYDNKSILLPTFSPHRISTSLQIKEYFMQFSARQNLKVELHTGTLSKTEIGENKYIMTGTYSFHFVENDANLTFPSRFTFILDISKERPIIHHHSSQIPRKGMGSD
jgi:hypothetical protein